MLYNRNPVKNIEYRISLNNRPKVVYTNIFPRSRLLFGINAIWMRNGASFLITDRHSKLNLITQR